MVSSWKLPIWVVYCQFPPKKTSNPPFKDTWGATDMVQSPNKSFWNSARNLCVCDSSCLYLIEAPNWLFKKKYKKFKRNPPVHMPRFSSPGELQTPSREGWKEWYWRRIWGGLHGATGHHIDVDGTIELRVESACRFCGHVSRLQGWAQHCGRRMPWNICEGSSREDCQREDLRVACRPQASQGPSKEGLL